MILDITHPLSPAIAEWPGDAPFTRTINARLAKGASVNLSSISLSVHNGTHADAPYHYDNDGLTMEQVPLDRFIGPALVIDVTGYDPIPIEALQPAERILLRTGGHPDITRFPDDFPVLAEDATDWLGQNGVKLIGVDVPSVDKPSSKHLPIHHGLRRNGVLILENLNLAGVDPGPAELIALPLKIVGADGSPVRAVLRR